MTLHKINRSYAHLVLKGFCLIGLFIVAGCETLSKTIEPILNQTSTVDVEQTPPIEPVTDKEQLAIDELKAQMEVMFEKQKELQAKLEQQKINLVFQASNVANAAKSTQATASTVYVAFLEDEEQFLDVQSLATEEYSIIPNRNIEASITLPEEAKYIAIKIDLRYTKKRSQFLIPIESIDFKTPISIAIGACDAFINSGIRPEQSVIYKKKLEFYQTPLVSCL